MDNDGKTIDSEDARRFLAVCNGIKESAPEVSWEEILFNTTDQAKVADFKLLSIASILNGFKDRDKLNQAMQIMHAVLIGQASDSLPSISWIHSFMMQHGTELTLGQINEIVKKLISVSSGPSLTFSQEGYNSTPIGWLVYQAYRRMKGDLLAIEKKGDLKDIYIPYEELKTVMMYNEFGIEQDIFPLILAIKTSIKILEEKAEQLMFKDEVSTHIKKIHEIMKEVRETPAWKRGEMRVKQFFTIAKLFGEVYQKLFEMLGTNLEFQSHISKIRILNSPIPRMIDRIVETWDSRNWASLLDSYAYSSVPFKIPTLLTRNTVVNAIKSFFNPKFKAPSESLPEGTKPMTALEDTSVLMKNVRDPTEEVIKNLAQEIVARNPSWDHDIVFVKDIMQSARRISAFLKIYSSGGVILGDYSDIKNPHKCVAEYRSHNISSIADDLERKLPKAEVKK